jgi:hypothetical protein
LAVNLDRLGQSGVLVAPPIAISAGVRALISGMVAPTSAPLGLLKICRSKKDFRPPIRQKALPGRVDVTTAHSAIGSALTLNAAAANPCF